MKGFAIHNSMTDHGGIIPATQMKASQMGNLFLLAGDGHFCPKCKCWSTIIKSHDHVIFFGKPVAYAGDKLTCGARVLPKQSHVVGDSGKPLYNLSPKNNFVSSFSNNQKFDEQIQFILENESEDLFDGLGYRIVIGQSVFEGTFDNFGKTERFMTDYSEQVSEFEIFFKEEIGYFHDLEEKE